MNDKPVNPEELVLLEKEGDIATDYLEELLDIIDFDGEFEIDIENGRATVDILNETSNEELLTLVGNNGLTLDALQELTRLAVQTKTGERSRLMLDIAAFRKNKKVEIIALVDQAIAKIRITGEKRVMDPMNPFERKVCHDTAMASGYYSASQGAEPNRCVVIYPAPPQKDELDEDSVAEELVAE